MFDEGQDRGPPTSLRGWLSDVYIPSLLDKAALEPIVKRLGGRATVDDPIFGRCSGLPALERYVADMSAWLLERNALYEKLHFTMGIDRDVTEGSLVLSFEEKSIVLPIAVVAERRKSREVELRLYYSTHPIKGTYAVRPPLVPEDKELALPEIIQTHVDALRKADLDGIMAGFESEGTLREARGVDHVKERDLREYYEKLLAAGAFGSGVEISKGATADNGRTCALEYTLVKMNGREVAPQAGLAVYERGDSGLLRSLRIYDDFEA